MLYSGGSKASKRYNLWIQAEYVLNKQNLGK